MKYNKKTILSEVKKIQKKLETLAYDELKKKVAETKKMTKKELPFIIAICCQAITRSINKKPFDVQILGALSLCDEKIAEIKTGEGKSLIAVLSACILHFYERNIHIMTVNEYLVKRDYMEFKAVFDFLGINVSYILEKMNNEQKINSYKADIVYGVSTEFAFDYLKDNMAKNKMNVMQNTLDFAIIDEADSILIDEAKTPIILSSSYNSQNKVFQSVNNLVKTFSFIDKKDISLTGELYDCIFDKKMQSVYLTDEGVKKTEEFFDISNLNAPENLSLLHIVNQSLKAHCLMEKEKDYIVKNGEIVLINSSTGRLADGKKFADGLHQAIEAKENITTKDITKTHASIATASFFDLYKSFAGMTGTIKTEETEIFARYNKDVTVIATNKPYIRKDLPDRIFIDKETKIIEIIKEIIDINSTGQPILVGTTSISKSKEISDALTEKNISHHLLNATNDEKESEIIAQAGRLGTVTVTTNMAGRGTDILLGGNPTLLTRNKLIEKGYGKNRVDAFLNNNVKDSFLESEFKSLYKEIKMLTEKEREKVVKLGGLYVIGTEHYDSQRIDNQLRGRAGRQGDPGKSQFFVSFDDDIITAFGNQNLVKTLKSGLVLSNKTELTNFPYDLFKSAQKQCEQTNAEYRKTVYEFDTANSYQRNYVYSLRKKILDGEYLLGSLISLREEIPSIIMDAYFSKNKLIEKNLHIFNEKYDKILKLELPADRNKKKVLHTVLEEKTSSLYSKKIEECKTLGANRESVWQYVLINTIDNHWSRYLDYLNNLKDISQISAFGTNSPIADYRIEASDAFKDFINIIKINAFFAFVNISFSTKIKL